MITARQMKAARALLGIDQNGLAQAAGPFHWQNRRLGMREMCRIQMFPDDYQVVGSLTEVLRQLVMQSRRCLGKYWLLKSVASCLMPLVGRKL